MFADVAEIMIALYPNAFGDFDVEDHGGIGHYVPWNKKV